MGTLRLYFLQARIVADHAACRLKYELSNYLEYCQTTVLSDQDTVRLRYYWQTTTIPCQSCQST